MISIFYQRLYPFQFLTVRCCLSLILICSTPQNELITHQENERCTLELERKHAIACCTAQELQERLERSAKYKTASMQQHDVIRALEAAVLDVLPSALHPDTRLDSAGYKRLLAQHLLLRQRRAAAMASTNIDAMSNAHTNGSTTEPPSSQTEIRLRETVQRLQAARMRGLQLQQQADAVSLTVPVEAPGALASTDPQVDALEHRKVCLEEEIRRMQQVRGGAELGSGPREGFRAKV